MLKALYEDSILIEYEEGDNSLERIEFSYVKNINDKNHIIKDGDTLDYLAYKYYKDDKLWYIIADTNNIYNPFELSIGDELIIPYINNI